MKIQCKDIYGNTHEFEEFEYIERKAAYGVYILNRQILLVQDKWTKKWGLPGGGFEKQETPQEALIREFKEETGLVIDNQMQELFTINSYFLAPGRTKPWKTKRTIYLISVIAGDLQTDIDMFDVIQSKYFPLDKISAMKKEIRENNLMALVLQKLPHY